MERKVALVTGGAQGLGSASAVALAKRGCTVVVADINGASAETVAAACRCFAPDSFAMSVDLATADGAQRAVAAAVSRLGRLDALINCAAVAPAEAFLDMTPAAWEMALLVNVRAVALAMAAAGREMMKRRSGRIVNVTSAAARMALPNYAAYAASKAAIDSLTRSGAVALTPHGILVNSVSPGMMDTPLQMRTEEIFHDLEGRSDLEAFKRERTARIPLGRRTTPEEMAETIIWLALDAPAYMTAARL
ncbi:MAG: SDR family NAD(P)-dependent oxidoreductase, partial [Hyphomicrobiaceae bacterium]